MEIIRFLDKNVLMEGRRLQHGRVYGRSEDVYRLFQPKEAIVNLYM